MPIQPPSEILAPLLARRSRLSRALRHTIRWSFLAAELRCSKPEEPDKLAFFFVEGLPLIERQFNDILRSERIRVRLGGIFCHQSPKVLPGGACTNSRRSCELGDILFLATYGALQLGFIGNALLVQAKNGKSAVGLQKCLYENAGEFEYEKPARLKGQTRKLEECTRSLWYWELDPGPFCSRSTPTIGRPPRIQGPWWPFHSSLLDLICGIEGRRVRKLAAGDRDQGWSKIVEDLISSTAGREFTRKNAGFRKVLRGSDGIRALRQDNFLAFSSIYGGNPLQFFRPGIKKLGVGLVAAEPFEGAESDDERPGEPVPPLGDRDNRGGEGCSFVILDFSQA